MKEILDIDKVFLKKEIGIMIIQVRDQRVYRVNINFLIGIKVCIEDLEQGTEDRI